MTAAAAEFRSYLVLLWPPLRLRLMPDFATIACTFSGVSDRNQKDLLWWQTLFCIPFKLYNAMENIPNNSATGCETCAPLPIQWRIRSKFSATNFSFFSFGIGSYVPTCSMTGWNCSLRRWIFKILSKQNQFKYILWIRGLCKLCTHKPPWQRCGKIHDLCNHVGRIE